MTLTRSRLPRTTLLMVLFSCLLVGCKLLNPFERLNTNNTKTQTTIAPRKEVLSPPGAPTKFSVRVGPYVFLSDFELQRDNDLFQDLEQLRDQVTRELRLPSGRSLIQVYLFETKDHYENFIRNQHPELPQRRAFFIAQQRSIGGPDDLLVYTYWGDRIQQDLRHELTHALLHSVLKNVPLWLDEGLAEYFELPAEEQGFNESHLKQLVLASEDPNWPSMERLEKFEEITQMGPAEYRESWAWVHLMLHGDAKGKQVLLEYLHELRDNAKPAPLAPRLTKAEIYPSLQEAFLKHLVNLEHEHLRTDTPMSIPTTP